jgi:hypothetical protein
VVSKWKPSREGEDWRDRELPWEPSFVPWLLQDIDPYRLRPADLLDKVFELRDKRSVSEYRQIRSRAPAGVGVGAGPIGAAGGALLGIVGEELIKRVSDKLWGFFFARPPFVNARKLLLRSVRAEQKTIACLTADPRTIWAAS